MPDCRACGEPIRFELTANGRKQPISLKTGVSHFADCPQADRFKKPAVPDNECHVCHGDNIEREPGKGPHYGKLRCLDCNAWRWQRKPQETRA